MKYKCKELGNIESLEEIEIKFKELKSNSNEFNEYEIEDFIKEFYVGGDEE